MGKSIIDTSSVTRVGLDLAKRVFRIHAVDATGSVVIGRSVNRRTLLKFFDALPRCVVAMEACSSAHHWGRQLLELGFAVRLIPPAHVKPYVRTWMTTISRSLLEPSGANPVAFVLSYFMEWCSVRAPTLESFGFGNPETTRT